MTNVLDLSTGNWLSFSCSPREAVIAAYAQSKGDFNTWDYTKYNSQVVESQLFVYCNQFGAAK